MLGNIVKDGSSILVKASHAMEFNKITSALENM